MVNIGFVAGHGSVNTEQRYAFTDRLTPELLSMKNIFYHLKQIDRDGQVLLKVFDAFGCEVLDLSNAVGGDSPTVVRELYSRTLAL